MKRKIFLADSVTRRVREIYSAAPRSINQDNHLGILRDRWIYLTLLNDEADV